MTPVRGLYAIYDRNGTPDDPLTAVNDILTGGAIWLQYRDKCADGPDRDLLAELRKLTRSHGAKLIINDDWRLAAAVKADGVHMGQTDGNLTAARAALGPQAIVGVSCQDSIEHARAGLAAGASYISFGRFYNSTTKPDAPPADPDILTEARSLGAPVCAIGGINADNASTLISAGADLIAVSAGVFAAAKPGAAAAQLAGLFD